MKVAVTYANGEIFQHFGHTEQFKIYEIEDKKVLRTRILLTEGEGHGALANLLAENNVDIAYSQLNNAIGLPFVDPYMIDTSLKYETVAVTMKEAVEIANNSRPDIKGAMLNIEGANQAVKLSWKTIMPALEFQANYGKGGIEEYRSAQVRMPLFARTCRFHAQCAR